MALLPAFAVRSDLDAARLVRVAPGWRGEDVEVWAVWTARALPGKARVFLDHLAARLTTTPE